MPMFFFKAIRYKLISHSSEIDQALQFIKSGDNPRGYANVVVAAIEGGFITEDTALATHLEYLRSQIANDWEHASPGYANVLAQAVESKIIKSEIEFDDYLKSVNPFLSDRDDRSKNFYPNIVIKAIERGLVKDGALVAKYLGNLEEHSQQLDHAYLALAAWKNNITSVNSLLDKAFANLEQSKQEREYCFAAKRALEVGFIHDEESLGKYLHFLRQFETRYFYKELVVKAMELSIIKDKSSLDKPLADLEGQSRWYADVVVKAIELGIISNSESLNEILQNLAGDLNEYARVLVKAQEYGLFHFDPACLKRAESLSVEKALPFSYALTVLSLGQENNPPYWSQAYEVLDKVVMLNNDPARRQDQKISAEEMDELKLHFLPAVANILNISPKVASQFFNQQLDNRGYLPMVRDSFKLLANLSPEEVGILRDFYEAHRELEDSDNGNPVQLCISLVGNLKTYQQLGIGMTKFKEDLVTAFDKGGRGLAGLGWRVLETIAFELGIKIDPTKRVDPISGDLNRWRTEYLGDLIAAKSSWGDEQRKFFTLLLKSTLEGTIQGLIDPSKYRSTDLGLTDEDEIETRDLVRRHNLQLLAEAEGLVVNVQAWLRPHQTVGSTELKLVGANRKDKNAFMNLKKDLDVARNSYKKWVEENKKGAWKVFTKKIGFDPLNIILIKPNINTIDNLKKAMRFDGFSVFFHENKPGQQPLPEAVIHMESVLDGMRYWDLNTDREADLRIRFWDRNPETETFLGNEVGSCTALDSNASAIFEFLLDQGTQYVIIEDSQGRVKGYARFFLIQTLSGAPGLYIDTVDGREAGAYYHEIYNHIIAFAQGVGISNLNVLERDGLPVRRMIPSRDDSYARKIGDALTKNYFHHSRNIIPASGAAYAFKGFEDWEPEGGWSKEAGARLASQTTKLLEPNHIFTGYEDVLKNAPAVIRKKLESYDLLSRDQIDAASQMLKIFRMIYEEMKLVDRNYHNAAHNDEVTFAEQILVESHKSIKTPMDLIVAFLIPAVHDIHIREANRTLPGGEEIGVPASVVTSGVQLRDMFGFDQVESNESVQGVLHSEVYREIMTDDRKNELRRLFKILIGSENKYEILARVGAGLRRTDYPNDVAPVPPSLENFSTEMRGTLQKLQYEFSRGQTKLSGDLRPSYRKRVSGVLSRMAYFTKTLVSRYPKVWIFRFSNHLVTKEKDRDQQRTIREIIERFEEQIEPEVNKAIPANDSKKRDDAIASLRRILSIESRYFEILMTVDVNHRREVNGMAHLFEKGGDQAGWYWILTALGILTDVIGGLHNEISMVSAVGTYPFFFRTTFLDLNNRINLRTLRALRRLPLRYRLNFVQNMEIFANHSTKFANSKKMINEKNNFAILQMRGSLDHWIKVKPAVLKILRIEPEQAERSAWEAGEYVRRQEINSLDRSGIVDEMLAQRPSNNSKFNPDLSPKPFHGVSAIVRINPESAAHKKLVEVQSKMKKELEEAGYDKVFAWLDPNSFHMTVAGIDPGKQLYDYAKPMEKKLVDGRIQQAVDAFDLIGEPGPIEAQIEGIGMRGGISADVRFENSAELVKVRDIEFAIKSKTGSNPSEFSGHVTLASIVNWPDKPEDIEKIVAIVKKYQHEIFGALNADSLELIYFEDMNHLSTLVACDLNSGAVQANEENIARFAAARLADDSAASTGHQEKPEEPLNRLISSALDLLNNGLNDEGFAKDLSGLLIGLNSWYAGRKTDTIYRSLEKLLYFIASIHAKKHAEALNNKTEFTNFAGKCNLARKDEVLAAMENAIKKLEVDPAAAWLAAGSKWPELRFHLSRIENPDASEANKIQAVEAIGGKLKKAPELKAEIMDQIREVLLRVYRREGAPSRLKEAILSLLVSEDFSDLKVKTLLIDIFKNYEHEESGVLGVGLFSLRIWFKSQAVSQPSQSFEEEIKLIFDLLPSLLRYVSKNESSANRILYLLITFLGYDLLKIFEVDPKKISSAALIQKEDFLKNKDLMDSLNELMISSPFVRTQSTAALILWILGRPLPKEYEGGVKAFGARYFKRRILEGIAKSAPTSSLPAEERGKLVGEIQANKLSPVDLMSELLKKGGRNNMIFVNHPFLLDSFQEGMLRDILELKEEAGLKYVALPFSPSLMGKFESFLRGENDPEFLKLFFEQMNEDVSKRDVLRESLKQLANSVEIIPYGAKPGLSGENAFDSQVQSLITAFNTKKDRILVYDCLSPKNVFSNEEIPSVGPSINLSVAQAIGEDSVSCVIETTKDRLIQDSMYERLHNLREFFEHEGQNLKTFAVYSNHTILGRLKVSREYPNTYSQMYDGLIIRVEPEERNDGGFLEKPEPSGPTVAKGFTRAKPKRLITAARLATRRLSLEDRSALGASASPSFVEDRVRGTRLSDLLVLEKPQGARISAAGARFAGAVGGNTLTTALLPKSAVNFLSFEDQVMLYRALKAFDDEKPVDVRTAKGELIAKISRNGNSEDSLLFRFDDGTTEPLFFSADVIKAQSATVSLAGQTAEISAKIAAYFEENSSVALAQISQQNKALVDLISQKKPAVLKSDFMYIRMALDGFMGLSNDVQKVAFANNLVHAAHMLFTLSHGKVVLVVSGREDLEALVLGGAKALSGEARFVFGENELPANFSNAKNATINALDVDHLSVFKKSNVPTSYVFDQALPGSVYNIQGNLMLAFIQAGLGLGQPDVHLDPAGLGILREAYQIMGIEVPTDSQAQLLDFTLGNNLTAHRKWLIQPIHVLDKASANRALAHMADQSA